MTEGEPKVKVDHTERAIDELFKGDASGKGLSDREFFALGGLAGRILLSGEFGAAATLYRNLQDRIGEGGYGKVETARLNGIADVVGSIAHYEPVELNIDEYEALSSANGQLIRKVPSPRISQLWDRGIVAVRRVGEFYSVELTPKGEKAKVLFEEKPMV